MDVTSLFAAEAERLRQAGVAGASGRLRDLFDWLASRGPDAAPATQEEIAREVFGQGEADADDATVRVYVHRLRKKIDDHYASKGRGEAGTRLELPSGIYALRPQGTANETASPPEPTRARPGRLAPALLGGLAVVLIAAIAFYLVQRPSVPNPIWQPLAESNRPVLLVLGDYYLFGEIDPVRPDEGRLIRDFRIDSAEELAALQEAEPERYGNAEDVGLNYLPFSSAYGLLEVLPLLTEAGEEVTVIPASGVQPDMLNYFDVVYVGLLSGMHVLEEQNFRAGGFAIGNSYDELVDRASGETWTSSEARSLPSPAFYEDHAYVARYTASTGAQVIVVASQRDTGLRGIAPLVAGSVLPAELADVAEGEGFEALFLISGQRGANLANRLLVARPHD
ncbi:MAG: winged helix-turn-helix domain-containing protein [Erythrobacter sp.]|nr:MAG: winged helix-turn-helix domain-containing protein [Erythrobacter sp.]